MTACGKCGEDIPEPGKFCGVCGTPAMTTTGSSVVLAEADTDPLARTAPVDPREIAKIRASLERQRVAPTVNDLVMVPAPGAKVQVEWSDGKKYPGTVKQASTEQCLVVFPDGQEKWVETKLVSPA